jgi:hypothetical protein
LFHKVGLVKAKYLTYSIGKMLRAPWVLILDVLGLVHQTCLQFLQD